MNSFFDQTSLDEIHATGLSIIARLPTAILYLIIVFVLYKIVRRLIQFLSTRTSATFAGPALRATKYFFIFAGIMLVCSAYGANLGDIWAMIGAVGALVAVGFVAVWSVLSNLSCTILILFFRPFEVGDDVEFTDPVGLRGKVINLNFAYTTLRAEDGRLVQIPNNLFFQRIIKRIPANPPTNPPFAPESMREKLPVETK